MTAAYEDFARRHLHIANDNSENFMVHCIYHRNEGSASMSFNVERGLFNCFSCHAHGSVKTLAKDLGIRLIEDPDLEVNALIGKLNKLRSQEREAELQLTTIAESSLGRYDFATDYWGQCPPVKPGKVRLRGCRGKPGCKQHRWLTNETIETFDLGFDPVNNIAIIPLRNVRGGLIGVIRRYLDEDAELRYKYPKGFARASHLFASWLVEHDTSDVAVLSEGAIDSMSVWQAGYMGLAQYGSSISRLQVRLLLRLGIREVILAHDNDKPGREATQQALGWTKHLSDGKMKWEYDEAVDLRRHFMIRKVDWAPYPRVKDLNTLSTSDLKELLADAQPMI